MEERNQMLFLGGKEGPGVELFLPRNCRREGIEERNQMLFLGMKEGSKGGAILTRTRTRFCF
jgi:hypothetical protein